MSAAESWERLSFSSLEDCELRYQRSTGEEYSRHVNLFESTTQLDDTITFMATVDEVTNDGYIIVHVDQSVVEQNVEIIESEKKYKLSLENYDPGIYVDSPVPGNVVIITCKPDVTGEDPVVITEIYSISPIGSSPAQMIENTSNGVYDWISSIDLPEGYYFSGFSDYYGYQGGFYILPRIYEMGENTGVPMEWQCSGMLTRVSSNYSQADITFHNGCPNLSGVPYHNHTYVEYIKARGVNAFDETKWPFIALFESHGLYTVPELEEMKQAGVDIDEIDLSSDYWYFWFVKEGADTYYVLSLSAKEFSKEQAMEIAESVCIRG